MSSSQSNRVIQYQNQRGISNKNGKMIQNSTTDCLQNKQAKQEDQVNQENQANVSNVNNAPIENSSALKLFLSSTKGKIIIGFVIGAVVVAVVASVVATQVLNKKDKSNEENEVTTEETVEVFHKHNYTNQDEEVFNDEDDEEGKEQELTQEIEDKYKSDIDSENVYAPPLSTFSLTKNNLIESNIIQENTRTAPIMGSLQNEEVIIPQFGGDAKETLEQYNQVLEENKQLVSGATTYDEIDEQGKLYLNGADTGNVLYRHPFSKGLYSGNISDSEKTVVKTMTINPISLTNYITGLYAPPGEVIKIQFDGNDLQTIGGQLEFIIGQVNQDGGGSENKSGIGLKRIPILFSKLIITKNPGYIGSFIGGPIYISNPPKKKIFTITISNAIPYKHLIYGVTTKEQFDAMASYTAPFFELDVRESIRYSGPLTIIKDLDYDNLVQNLIFWDKCVRTSRKVPTGSNINKGIHFLFDPCVNAAGALALAYVGANWCQVPPSFSMALDYETITKYGAWGHIHELNHHFQRFGFSSGVQNEVTNNVVNLIEYILFSQISGLRNEFSDSAIKTVSGNHIYLDPEYSLKHLNNNPPTADNEIRFYEPILQAFGYDLFIKVTQYGKGSGGVDLFYRALTEVLQYDFTYYVEKILNLEISDSVVEECQSHGYHIFIPVSSIYQTGRYYNHDSHQHFSNTSLPYRIPRGGPSTLDFEKHIIVPNGFTYEINEITQPKYGTLAKISDKIYQYTPDDHEDLSGIIKLTLHVTNSEENIHTNVKLGLNFQVDNTQSVQTDYIYDEIIYKTTIYDAINANFAGYSKINFYPNFAGIMSGVKEGNIGVWEGKFKIDDEGYNYILYKGGRGPSVLYAKINNEPDYYKIGEIEINQSGYMFSERSKAFYQIALNINDVVYFKVYLLGKTLNSGTTGWINIGISKTNNENEVRTLGKKDIVGVNAEFDQPYTFYSGDPYKEDKVFDSYSFFDYSLIEVSSPNFEPWDDTVKLEKMIDNNENTYMHTKKNFRISEVAPLILYFDLGKKYPFDTIIFDRGPTKGMFLPLNVKVSTSEDNSEWDAERAYTCESSEDKYSILNLGSTFNTRYIKLSISKQMYGDYVAIAKIDFIEKKLKLYLKPPEFAEFEGKTSIDINYDNFPYFGHSYILNPGSAISFLIEKTTGIRIKVCHKNNAKVNLIVDNDTANKIEITILGENNIDYPIIKNGLDEGKYRFKIEVIEGSIDFEYILYEV